MDRDEKQEEQQRRSASADLGGTASHHRASYNDPIAGYPDPILGTSGVEAEEASGTTSTVGRSSGASGWIRHPIDQGGFGAHLDPAEVQREVDHDPAEGARDRGEERRDRTDRGA